MPEIKGLLTGNFENCYIIYEGNKALIVDPGFEPDKISAEIDHLGVTPAAILLTHCHFDHIGALEAIRSRYSIPVYVSPLEQEWLVDPTLNFSANREQPVSARPAEFEFETLKTYDINGLTFNVLPTPGHSPGSVSFIFDDFAVVGDALFKGSIGRTDLPYGDTEQLLAGIKEQLFTLPDETPVYSGHGEPTTIGHEKRTNPFFN